MLVFAKHKGAWPVIIADGEARREALSERRLIVPDIAAVAG
jgi:hypothetical protein